MNKSFVLILFLFLSVDFARSFVRSPWISKGKNAGSSWISKGIIVGAVQSLTRRKALQNEHFEALELVEKYMENISQLLGNSTWIDEQDERTLAEAEEKLEGYKTILKLSKVLRDTEADLDMCRGQLESDDPSIKGKASIFLDKFTRIRSELEDKLILLLTNKFLVENETSDLDVT
jgi:hypothetical protein